MEDNRLKRFKELEKYFDDYAHGKFDEDDQLLDELSHEIGQLEKELIKDGILA